MLHLLNSVESSAHLSSMLGAKVIATRESNAGMDGMMVVSRAM